MVGSQLNSQPWFAVDVDTVPIVLRLDRATQQSSPEGALGGQVGGVEDDDLSSNPHAVILPRAEEMSEPGLVNGTAADAVRCEWSCVDGDNRGAAPEDGATRLAHSTNTPDCRSL